jgi:hypothetical protein
MPLEPLSADKDERTHPPPLSSNNMDAFLAILLLAVAANGLLLMLLHGLNRDGPYLLDAKHALTLPDGELAD